jgi:hypothetical protein
MSEKNGSGEVVLMEGTPFYGLQERPLDVVVSLIELKVNIISFILLNDTSAHLPSSFALLL